MDVHVNAAMSADGKLSSRKREPVAISGPSDFERVSGLRSAADAVMVGVGTILADDPSLGPVHGRDEATRNPDVPPADRPTRVVADSRGRTPPTAAVLDGHAPTVILVSEAAPADRIAALEGAGATVVTHGQDRVDLVGAIESLEDRGIHDLLVEGGGEVIYSLFEADLVDRLTVYVAPTIIGGREAPTLVDGMGFTEAFPALTLAAVERLDGGVLLRYRC